MNEPSAQGDGDPGTSRADECRQLREALCRLIPHGMEPVPGVFPAIDAYEREPELLAALKGLVDAYEDPTRDDPHSLVVTAREAIANTEGVR